MVCQSENKEYMPEQKCAVLHYGSKEPAEYLTILKKVPNVLFRALYLIETGPVLLCYELVPFKVLLIQMFQIQ